MGRYMSSATLSLMLSCEVIIYICIQLYTSHGFFFLHILIFISHIYLYSLAYWALTGWKFWLSNSVILRTIRNFFYLFDHKNVLNYEFPQKTCILSLKIYLLFIALLMYRKTLLNHRCDFLYTSVPPKDYLVIIFPIIVSLLGVSWSSICPHPALSLLSPLLSTRMSLTTQ